MKSGFLQLLAKYRPTLVVLGLVQKLITRAGGGCPKTDSGALLILLEATVTREAMSQLDLSRMMKETIGVPSILGHAGDVWHAREYQIHGSASRIE